MISDERLEKIEQLVSSSLNDQSVLQKVREDDHPLGCRSFPVGRPRGCERQGICCQGVSLASLKYPCLTQCATLSQANHNRLLDVARETYKENVGDIFTLNSALSEEHGLPLTLVYQDSGFVFTLKKSDLEGELPSGFVNVSAKKGKWVFSSVELVSVIP